MTVMAPAASGTVPVAVASLSTRNSVAEVMLVMRAPPGIPTPETGMPTRSPDVLATVTVAEPRVVPAPARLVTAEPAPKVCRIPPELIRRMPPSGTASKEEPAALNRTEIGATTFCKTPA